YIFFNVFTIAFSFHYTGKRIFKLIPPMKINAYFIFYIFPLTPKYLVACNITKHRFAFIIFNHIE
ncbi:hypothetical protein D5I31_18255, partial [Salmonella enterica]|nr:hypothetical protein [Salmonella enterica]